MDILQARGEKSRRVLKERETPENLLFRGVNGRWRVLRERGISFSGKTNGLDGLRTTSRAPFKVSIYWRGIEQAWLLVNLYSINSYFKVQC